MTTTTAPAPRALIDATHLELVKVFAAPSRQFCYAGCPTWLNDTGCDCPPHQPIR